MNYKIDFFLSLLHNQEAIIQKVSGAITFVIVVCACVQFQLSFTQKVVVNLNKMKLFRQPIFVLPKTKLNHLVDPTKNLVKKAEMSIANFNVKIFTTFVLN